MNNSQITFHGNMENNAITIYQSDDNYIAILWDKTTGNNISEMKEFSINKLTHNLSFDGIGNFSGKQVMFSFAWKMHAEYNGYGIDGDIRFSRIATCS